MLRCKACGHCCCSSYAGLEGGPVRAARMGARCSLLLTPCSSSDFLLMPLLGYWLRTPLLLLLLFPPGPRCKPGGRAPLCPPPGTTAAATTTGSATVLCCPWRPSTSCSCSWQRGW
jgi:hypothetical protein